MKVRVVGLAHLVNPFHEARKLLELRPLVVGGLDGDVDLDRLLDADGPSVARIGSGRTRRRPCAHECRKDAASAASCSRPLGAAFELGKLVGELVDLGTELRVVCESPSEARDAHRGDQAPPEKKERRKRRNASPACLLIGRHFPRRLNIRLHYLYGLVKVTSTLPSEHLSSFSGSRPLVGIPTPCARLTQRNAS